MSWLQDLAGKAENILTKIDQNAATVLRQSADGDDVDASETLLEVTTAPSTSAYFANHGFHAPTVNTQVPKALLLSAKPSTNTLVRSSSSASHEKSLFHGDLETRSLKSEQQNLSRRSSVSSKKDGTVIEFTAYPVESKNVVNHDYSAEKELAATKIVLAEVKSERDELKLELDSAQLQTSNSENEAKIKELEALYQIILDEKNDLYVKLLSVEESNAKYIKSISELESIVSKHNQNEQELSQKLEMAQMETNNAIAELQQYKCRAHATLQMKDKMIEQLKENVIPTLDQDVTSNRVPEQIMVMEMEQLKNDRQNLIEEISILSGKFENGKLFWQSMEDKLKRTILDLEDRITELQQKLSVETTKALQLDDDLNIKNKELLSVREELIKQRTNFSVKIHDMEAEIAKLRNKSYNRPTSPSSDLEQRLSSLTQSLVQKQSTLESITAERNALRLQLEKLDTQYRSTVTQIRQQRVPFMNSNETDDAKSQVPNFMIENPFDNNVARRVKRAYSSLDSIGIRLGVFLRRYPLIRILVIVYVATLHLWVMFVLLSSTPSQ